MANPILSQKLASKNFFVVPGMQDMISTVIANKVGFDIVYGTGYWLTASAYGLSKEEALSAVTLNAANILGIADKTGSIETGKDANIVVSEGDILDMRTNIITQAFIQGRQVDLNNKQKQLAEKYETKYGIK